ncbi:MAG: pentapeptide repeat-containing protein [Actinophytocola sp.]|uniref:pentapeptide repeat-containing protein n=1 Tax=Actinophytocola sp. TaxID=1872138 RepID=UPI003C70EBAD
MPAEDPRPDFDPHWPVCTEEGCRGAQSEWERRCLVHAEDLAGLRPGGDLDLRGAAVDSAKLVEIVYRFRDHENRAFMFGELRCDHAWFSGRASFTGGEVRGVARFSDVHFGHLASFDGMAFASVLSFRGARFPGRAYLGPLAAGDVDLAETWFANRVSLDIEAEHVELVDAQFDGGLLLETTGEVDANGTYFGAASTIHGAKVASLSGSDVSNLVLTDADLSNCYFLGAHRLEQLRIDGRTTFARPRSRWRARRRMLADEGKEPPARVGATYRALRKSLEDSKNEAGAGDFYYGEMECRRHSKESSLAERMILWCYWLLSGYGQRALRALAWLVVVVSVVTGLLTVWGQDFGMAARIAVGAVVFRDDRTELTAAGEWTVLVARFLGPVLLALAVLAIRARVKR